MPDIWTLTVDIPADELVRRKGKIVRRALGIPALHNLRGPWKQHRVAKVHAYRLEGGLSGHETEARWAAQQLAAGYLHEVLLIRRAPRPLDAAVQDGEWGRGGRQIYGDNLSSALKPTRDWVARRVFGLDGDSTTLIRWHVGQEKSSRPKLYQLEVVIAPPAERWWELPDRWLRGEL